MALQKSHAPIINLLSLVAQKCATNGSTQNPVKIDLVQNIVDITRREYQEMFEFAFLSIPGGFLLFLGFQLGLIFVEGIPANPCKPYTL